ncbi:hypothetical protein [Streptomyces sp. NBC_01615]|uniref:hypothetical protein n=1 Tax=Streptomyces sp. NBC_01615 TaxID=2975898 RepID=UPI003865AC82
MVVDDGDALVVVVGEGLTFPGPGLLEREQGDGIPVPLVGPVLGEPAEGQEAAIFRWPEG